jgi:nucleoside-diphosphate kinase
MVAPGPRNERRNNAVVRGNLFMGTGFAGSMAEGSVERTLVLVKPDGVRRGLIGEIVGRLERKGLKLVAARLMHASPELAARHYAEHQGKPFYPGLVQHITSAPIFAMAVEGRSAIAVVRSITGATNPQTAAPGTVRGDLALAITPNLIHASDSPDSAARELALYFTEKDYLRYERVGAEYQ